MRQKLASEATAFTRQIFASLPLGVRLAATINNVFRARVGYSQGDAESFGLQMLYAFRDAQVSGPIHGKLTMVDLEPALRRGIGSKLKETALNLSNKTTRRIRSKFSDDLVEQAIADVTDKLLMKEIKINKGSNISQATSYIQKPLEWAANDAARKTVRHDKAHKKIDPSEIMGIPDPSTYRGSLPPKALSQISKDIDRTFRDKEEAERIKAWFTGQVEGKSLDSIAGAFDLSRPGFQKWVGKRMNQIRKILSPYHAYLQTN